MTGRSPRAARTLIRQVREGLGRKPDSKAGLETAVPVDEPDGFGVHREFRFDKVASKWFLDNLGDDAILNDSRIHNVVGDKGIITVTFSADSRLAEDRTDFDMSGPAESVE